MRKVLLAMALLVTAAACGTSPTSPAAARGAQLNTGPADEVCTKYAMAGARNCEAPSEP